MIPKVTNMELQKNSSDINSSLGDYTASIHLEDDFFISSPKIGTVKTSLIVQSKNQISTPIFTKNHISSTVFINCEQNSPSQKSNDMELEKNNVAKKNISNINLICKPFSKFKIELNDMDNIDLNTGSEKQIQKINSKKIKNEKDKNSIIEQNNKNNRPKNKNNKENKKSNKLENYKNDANNIKNHKNPKRLSTVEFSNFSEYLYKYKENNNSNNSSRLKRENNKTQISRFKSEKKVTNLKDFKNKNNAYHLIYNSKNEKNNLMTKYILKSSSLLPVYLKKNKETKNNSGKFNHSQKTNFLLPKKMDSQQQIDENEIKEKRKQRFKSYRKENPTILRNFKNRGNKKIDKESSEKTEDNKLSDSKKIFTNCFQIKKHQSVENINFNKYRSSNSIGKINAKKTHHLFSFDKRKYKHSNPKNKNQFKNYNHNNSKNSKNKTNGTKNKKTKNNNTAIFLKSNNELLPKKLNLNSNIYNTFAHTKKTTDDLMHSFSKKRLG